MSKTAVLVTSLIVAAVASHFISDSMGYELQWTHIGVCATALIAIWKLREDSDQKAIDRELQTKREILFSGIRAMTKAQAAFTSLSNLNVSFRDASLNYQEASADMTMAATVASVDAAKCGNQFTNKLGPLFMEAMKQRADLDQLPGGSQNPDFVAKHRELVAFILDNLLEVGKALLRTIAAVRVDVGIARESNEKFLDAVYPDEVALRMAINKVLGRPQE
jgi:hypothetical protein